jgi:hypothetical protein
MYIPTQSLNDPIASGVTHRSPVAGGRAAKRGLTARQGIALYVIGVFAETLGLALIAAYGWFAVGAPLAAAGVWIATAGNRAWPDSEESVTVTQQMLGYLTARGHRDQLDGASNDRGR